MERKIYSNPIWFHQSSEKGGLSGSIQTTYGTDRLDTHDTLSRRLGKDRPSITKLLVSTHTHIRMSDGYPYAYRNRIRSSLR